VIYRPERSTYVATGLLCATASAAGLSVYLVRSEELGLYTVIAGLLTWVILWSHLAGQSVEVTPAIIEKRSLWILRKRLRRAAVQAVARGTNPITDGPDTVTLVAGASSLKINLRLYPTALADIIREMT
jgi:hypothetical protein